MKLTDLDRVIEATRAALETMEMFCADRDETDDLAEALTLLRKMRDSAIEVRAWRHGGKHGRWQAEAGPITATDATVHDALLLITPEDS